MMKRGKWIALIVVNLLSLSVSAQTYGELFKQKKTQKKYLLEQIAALQAYKKYLGKGYGIVKEGSGLIGSITGGAFDLHQRYFQSLKSVNPALLKNGKVDAILRMQKEMDQMRIVYWKRVGLGDLFTSGERIAIKGLFDGMERDCNGLLGELELVLSDGKVEMGDDERIRRIDGLYNATISLYQQHKRAVRVLASLSTGRQQELKEVELLKKIQQKDR